MCVRYRYIDYLSTAAQRNLLHLKLINLTLLQYCITVVGAETVIRALQLTATQLQWTMKSDFEGRIHAKSILSENTVFSIKIKQ